MSRPYSLLSDDWIGLLSRRKKVRYDKHYVSTVAACLSRDLGWQEEMAGERRG
jgi:hypothetical protein